MSLSPMHRPSGVCAHAHLLALCGALRISRTDGDPTLGAPIPFGATDIALAPNGDLFVADANRNRISRVVPSTGAIDLIAESLHGPSGIALSPTGGLYVADTLDNRIRLIAPDTGGSRTVAGDGGAGTREDVGDGLPGPSAHLERPTGLAVAPTGPVYRRYRPSPRPEDQREHRPHFHNRRRWCPRDARRRRSRGRRASGCADGAVFGHGA